MICVAGNTCFTVVDVACSQIPLVMIPLVQLLSTIVNAVMWHGSHRRLLGYHQLEHEPDCSVGCLMPILK